MTELTVRYPDDLLLASGRSRSAVEERLRFELAVRLFEVGQLQLGKAAELAGLSTPRFGEELGRLKIPTINLDDAEIETELSAFRGNHHRGQQQRLNLRRMGTVALLGQAKRAGLVKKLKPSLDALLDCGIYIRKELIEAALKEAGE